MFMHMSVYICIFVWQSSIPVCGCVGVFVCVLPYIPFLFARVPMRPVCFLFLKKHQTPPKGTAELRRERQDLHHLLPTVPRDEAGEAAFSRGRDSDPAVDLHQIFPSEGRTGHYMLKMGEVGIYQKQRCQFWSFSSKMIQYLEIIWLKLFFYPNFYGSMMLSCLGLSNLVELLFIFVGLIFLSAENKGLEKGRQKRGCCVLLFGIFWRYFEDIGSREFKFGKKRGEAFIFFCSFLSTSPFLTLQSHHIHLLLTSRDHHSL